ncbi:MAG: NAD(P)H-binding protein [Gammaproteobacteria bacterium]|nr:NAD(P)H-binding protein [Gammaproteobacteria bacterium]MCP4089392.1 NAD(P)H-binding protein [Gammaproteobacteria bacterium]MCP4277507.1 NAD(P)H-binding protein [Gammaproteobacteria bacterium]MCP4831115.1 NAD(P)H-binding protein [Gammaproteobacteria bacterium]MCP4928539.1 NAD(P)H-binding protein [Gammaproteobacteria bacterium]
MNNENTQTVLIVGSTGYIGRAVVAEAVNQGYDVIAVTRSPAKEGEFAGAEVLVGDVSSPASIATMFPRKVDVVISCLATRSGLPKDFDDIDYIATLNVLNAAQEHGAEKFILLSAICVRKPDLPLQLAKLKMEDALMRSGIDYTIVRPTAYFWVFDTQTEMIMKGRPGYVVGSGEQAVHNPIAREDLAEFMVSSITNTERKDRVFVLGGPEVPDNIVSYRDALNMVFESLGKEPNIKSVPVWVLNTLINITWFIGLFSRKIGMFSAFLKVTRYYLVNDMRAPGYGSRTLKEHIMDTTRKIDT